MEVIIRPTALDAVKLTAKLIADSVKSNPKLVLGLATGRTMEQLWKFIELYKDGEVDFSECKSFNLDEYIGLAGDDKKFLLLLYELSSFQPY